jgi:hypothetical protein
MFDNAPLLHSERHTCAKYGPLSFSSDTDCDQACTGAYGTVLTNLLLPGGIENRIWRLCQGAHTAISPIHHPAAR